MRESSLREPSLREPSARDFDDAPRQSARTVGGGGGKAVRRKPAAPSLLRRALARFAKRPVKNLVAALFASAAAGILVNALALQKERHPAPIFSTAQAEKDREAMRQIAAAPAIPVPTPRPAAAQVSPQGSQQAEPTLAKAEKPRETGAADARVEARAKDPIAQLIKTGLVAPSSPAVPAPAQEAKAPQPSAPVLAAQRALVKLGYVLKADGVAGPTTRQAVEIFERERKWPVKGELTPKVMKEILAAAE